MKENTLTPNKMRYLIIDTEHVKYNEDGFEPQPYFTKRTLSEQETMAVFKEVWEDGCLVGSTGSDYDRGVIPVSEEEKAWQEYSKKL